MSLFFNLLPADLQIGIFYDWLNDNDSGSSLLKALSAMDVACARWDRSALLALFGQLPAFGGNTAHCGHPVRYRALRWLARRTVPVKALLLSGCENLALEGGVRPPLTLPFIETLHWHAQADGSSEDLSAVVVCLPNLTAIQQTSSSPVVMDASLTPKLKAVTIASSARPSLLGNELPLPCLGTCFQLQEMRIERFKLTPALSEHLQECCPNLMVLEVSMRDMEMSDLHTVLNTLTRLEEITVHDLPPNHAPEIAVCGRIRKLTVRGPDLFDNEGDVFSRVLALRPDMDYLRINGFAFSKMSGLLELPVDVAAPSAERLESILDQCNSLQMLSWKAPLPHDLAVLLAKKCEGKWQSLTVRAAFVVLNTLLQGSQRFLTNLDLDYGQGGPSPLPLIAASCPHLVSLSLRFVSGSQENYLALFAACKELKELTLQTWSVTYRPVNRRVALECIVAQKVRLNLLTLIAFNESDGDWFRQQCREHQVLPVPIVRILK